MEVSNKLDREMSLARVIYHYGSHKLQTIHFIKECGDRTRQRLLASVPMSVNTSCITCFDPFHKAMENTLCVWLKDTTEGVYGHAEEDTAISDHSFLTKSSVSTSAMILHCSNTDNFQPET